MKTIKLTESELTAIVKNIVNEIQLHENAMEAISMEINQEMDDLGEPPLSAEDINDLAGCEDTDESEVPQEHLGTFKKLKFAIEQADKGQLKDAFRQIKAAMKNQKSLNEQAETALILGIPVVNAVLIIIGGLLLISILGRMIKNLLSREREYVPSCRQGRRAVRDRRGY